MGIRPVAGGFGIRNTAQGIRNPTIDWNPESSWTLSSCRNFLLFRQMYKATGHGNEKERNPPNGEMSPLATEGPVKLTERLTWTLSHTRFPFHSIPFHCYREAVGTPPRHTGPWLFSLFFTWVPRKRTTMVWINR